MGTHGRHDEGLGLQAPQMSDDGPGDDCRLSDPAGTDGDRHGLAGPNAPLELQIGQLPVNFRRHVLDSRPFELLANAKNLGQGSHTLHR